MAKHNYRLLQEAIDRQADIVEGMQPGEMQAGDEFEHDFGDTEQAVIAAGWVERTDEPKKGGKK